MKQCKETFANTSPMMNVWIKMDLNLLFCMSEATDFKIYMRDVLPFSLTFKHVAMHCSECFQMSKRTAASVNWGSSL